MSKICRCKIRGKRFMHKGLAQLHLRVVHSIHVESIARVAFGSSQPDKPHPYPGLTSFLVNYACEVEGGSSSLLRECYDVIMSHHSCNEATTELVEILANSHKQRAGLLTLASKLGCHNNRELRECLQQDQDLLSNLLQQAIRQRDTKDRILAFPEEVASAFLNLVDSTLIDCVHAQSTDTTARNSSHRLLYRFSVWLCEKLHCLPKSLHLDGVVLANPNNCASAGGAFADIYKGYLGERPVAVKVLRTFPSNDDQPKRVKAFYREIALLHHLKHININSMLGVDRQLFPGKICLISPWMHYGNIREYIRSKGFDSQEVHRLLAEVACGLTYLHHEKIAHGDLRGANILIDDKRRVKLADFGLSNFVDTSQSSAITGALRWMAPEILDPDQFGLQHVYYTEASDVYSFGHVFWELYNDEDPFPEFKRSVQVISPVLKKHRPSRTLSQRKFPDCIWKMTEDCWQHDPKDRPSAASLKDKLLDFLAPKPESLPMPRRRLESMITPRSNNVSRVAGSLTISYYPQAPGVQWTISNVDPMQWTYSALQGVQRFIPEECEGWDSVRADANRTRTRKPPHPANKRAASEEARYIHKVDYSPSNYGAIYSYVYN